MCPVLDRFALHCASTPGGVDTGRDGPITFGAILSSWTLRGRMFRVSTDTKQAAGERGQGARDAYHRYGEVVQ